MAINKLLNICGTFHTHTWTVWTCGDWITDGWAAWITPWTWTVCPLGSCTKVTVGADDVAWAAGMDTYRNMESNYQHRSLCETTQVQYEVITNKAKLWPSCLIRIQWFNILLKKISNAIQVLLPSTFFSLTQVTKKASYPMYHLHPKPNHALKTKEYFNHMVLYIFLLFLYPSFLF